MWQTPAIAIFHSHLCMETVKLYLGKLFSHQTVSFFQETERCFHQAAVSIPMGGGRGQPCEMFWSGLFSLSLLAWLPSLPFPRLSGVRPGIVGCRPGGHGATDRLTDWESCSSVGRSSGMVKVGLLRRECGLSKGCGDHGVQQMLAYNRV